MKNISLKSQIKSKKKKHELSESLGTFMGFEPKLP
jgi:hypothetical protein